MAEVNSPVLLDYQTSDQNTSQFIRVRILDSANSAVSGSPFTLSHVANGRYISNSWTPTVEGYYSLAYEVYSDAGFTTPSTIYGWIGETVEVRSIDQDLSTLLSRLTSGRATNLDNLDATISSRNSTTHFDVVVGTPAGASVSADIAAVKSDTNTLTSRLTSGRATNLDNLDATVSSRAPSATAVSNLDYTSARALKIDNLDATISSRAPSSTAVSNADYTSARALKIDNLDATISSRAPSATAISNVDYTALRAANLDNLDATISSRLATAGYTAPDNATIGTINTKIGTPVGTVSTDIASVKSDTSVIENTVWDALSASHVTPGTMGELLFDAGGGSSPSLVAQAVWNEVKSAHTTPGTFGALLDVAVSTRSPKGADILITVGE